jgi:hypothetical protein
MSFGSVAQRFAQDRNTSRECTFFDKNTWPDVFQQLLFASDIALTLHQKDQDVDGLWIHGHHLAGAK